MPLYAFDPDNNVRNDTCIPIQIADKNADVCCNCNPTLCTYRDECSSGCRCCAPGTASTPARPCCSCLDACPASRFTTETACRGGCPCCDANQPQGYSECFSPTLFRTASAPLAQAMDLVARKSCIKAALVQPTQGSPHRVCSGERVCEGADTLLVAHPGGQMGVVCCPSGGCVHHLERGGLNREFCDTKQSCTTSGPPEQPSPIRLNTMVAVVAGVILGGLCVGALFWMYQRIRVKTNRNRQSQEHALSTQLLGVTHDASGPMLLRDDVKVGKRIGSGASSVIFQGSFRGIPVALKEIIETMVCGDSSAILQEANMLVQLGHPHVVSFYGVWQYVDQMLQMPRMYLVMELCGGGSLDEHLHRADLDPAIVWKWMRQIALAMEYLHSRQPPVIHRDLKPGNVLLLDQTAACCKICDFGVARHVASEDEKASRITTRVGTIAYMPPEVLNLAHDGSSAADVSGQKWDVYSCGMVFTAVLERRHPYDGLKSHEIIASVCQDLPEAPPSVLPHPDLSILSHSPLLQLVQDMRSADAAARPDFAEVTQKLDQIMSMLDAS